MKNPFLSEPIYLWRNGKTIQDYLNRGVYFHCPIKFNLEARPEEIPNSPFYIITKACPDFYVEDLRKIKTNQKSADNQIYDQECIIFGYLFDTEFENEFFDKEELADFLDFFYQSLSGNISMDDGIFVTKTINDDNDYLPFVIIQPQSGQPRIPS
ncbi:MAG: hypothetical protein ABIF08_02865 [Nanoarchaeota archaeon]